MMTNSLRLIVAGVLGFTMVGCGTAPIQATTITSGTSAWVEDPSFGLYYCTANEGEKGPKPICVVPKRVDEAHPVQFEKAAVTVAPAAAVATPSTPAHVVKDTH